MMIWITVEALKHAVIKEIKEINEEMKSLEEIHAKIVEERHRISLAQDRSSWPVMNAGHRECIPESSLDNTN